jgi:hypothetical protein
MSLPLRGELMLEDQILIKRAGVSEWKSIRPTGRKPYQFETVDKAWAMLESCYPDILRREARVVLSNKDSF